MSRRPLPLVSLIVLSVNASAHSVARQWNEQLLAAIRINVPNPPGHARNLFHTAVAMYDAWAAYAATAIGYIRNEKVSPLPPTPAEIYQAREEAISYAAYRVLRARFGPPAAGSATTLASLDAELSGLGFSPAVAQGAVTNAPSPAELGKRVGQAVLDWGAADGFTNTAYPQPYDAAVNPNLNFPLSVLGTNGAGFANMPLGYGIPIGTNPNLWQPLSLATSISQNGLPLPGGVQPFVGVQGLATTPFSLRRSDSAKPWMDPFGGPSRLSVPGAASATDAAYKAGALGVLRASSQLNDETMINVSPGAIGNNPLGSDSGTGFASNPVAGGAYAPNMVKRGDFVRVLAEFWADGPNSETPPGHWHVLANDIAESPSLVKRIGGQGPLVDDLEWDVKVYFALSAATHDAACAAWSLKRYYSGPRPITMIRYMGSKGQSSNSSGPSYHPQGLPLEPGVVEVITEQTAAAGERHEWIWDVRMSAFLPGTSFLGKIAVRSWPGEHPNNAPAPAVAENQSEVTWMLAEDWLPFQRKTFNTPAFPGYISGHSTFSRAAAEVLTKITGSPYFPGGFHHHTVGAESLQIDLGPSVDVDLQWCTYYDAADQAGQSRRWGGIHPSEDDFHGRHIGSVAGKSAYSLAEKYWTGTVLENPAEPEGTALPSGGARLTWEATRGMYHKVQSSTTCSPDPADWTDLTSYTRAYDTVGAFVDAGPLPQRKYYRILRTSLP